GEGDRARQGRLTAGLLTARPTAARPTAARPTACTKLRFRPQLRLEEPFRRPSRPAGGGRRRLGSDFQELDHRRESGGEARSRGGRARPGGVAGVIALVRGLNWPWRFVIGAAAGLPWVAIRLSAIGRTIPTLCFIQAWRWRRPSAAPFPDRRRAGVGALAALGRVSMDGF